MTKLVVILEANPEDYRRQAWFKRAGMAMLAEKELALIDALRDGATVELTTTATRWAARWEAWGSIPGWESWPICATLSGGLTETAPADDASPPTEPPLLGPGDEAG